MTKRFLVAAAAALFALPATAQDDATQNTSHSVSVIVPAVELLNVSSNTVTLEFDSPTAGQGFDDVTDGSATYDVTLNKQVNTAADGAAPAMEDAEYKITAHTLAAFGDGITVSVNLSAIGSPDADAPDTGYVTIPAATAADANGDGDISSDEISGAIDVKSGLSRTSGQGSITYKASATMDAVPATYTQTVYYTLVQTN